MTGQAAEVRALIRWECADVYDTDLGRVVRARGHVRLFPDADGWRWEPWDARRRRACGEASGVHATIGQAWGDAIGW